jgi:hypothetical protein
MRNLIWDDTNIIQDERLYYTMFLWREGERPHENLRAIGGGWSPRDALNLESYQGIDLLLESFALVMQKMTTADLVIIGGDRQIQQYESKAQILPEHKVHFLGPKPLAICGVPLRLIFWCLLDSG